MLDPIVSLAVAVAEGPGSYAVLVGSGASRDAGVPTGGEVFRLAVEDLMFMLVASRYEQASLIVTSNKTFSAWGEIFRRRRRRRGDDRPARPPRRDPRPQRRSYRLRDKDLGARTRPADPALD